jgi:methylmalonyl-CoA/ethylmalonyl-CoA epimerase
MRTGRLHRYFEACNDCSYDFKVTSECGYMRFDHIGIVVDDIAKGKRFLSESFGIELWTEVFDDPGIGVFVQFGKGTDGPCYEIIAARGEASPVSGVLRSGKNILNHIAYLVPDLDLAAKSFQMLGCLPISEPKPAVAFNGHRVQFLSSPLKFLLELIEAPGHRHLFVGDEARGDR